MSVVYAWASGPVQSSSPAGIPSVRTASGKASRSRPTDFSTGCFTDAIFLIISGWKPKYAFNRSDEEQRRRCPLCRGTIPPSREEISHIKLAKSITKNTSHPRYDKYAEQVKQFKAKYGEDWEDSRIEYSSDFVSIPIYVARAASTGNFRTVLQWLGKGSIKERVNAKYEGNTGLLFMAAVNGHHDLMSYLLLNGADENTIEPSGASLLAQFCKDKKDYPKTVRMLLSWGAELFLHGKQITKEEKLELCDYFSERNTTARLLSSELGGRRCEIVSAPNTHGNLIGKTCVVEEYVTESDQYKVTVEFTNEDLLLGADNLKRRDRTPRDPGYYVEWKINRLIRREFESNEECQAFIASLSAEKDEVGEVDPDAENKAEQAAADLLAELGLGDLDGPSSSASKKEKQPVAAGKKKKRGGKKKGRK